MSGSFSFSWGTASGIMVYYCSTFLAFFLKLDLEVFFRGMDKDTGLSIGWYGSCNLVAVSANSPRRTIVCERMMFCQILRESQFKPCVWWWCEFGAGAGLLPLFSLILYVLPVVAKGKGTLCPFPVSADTIRLFCFFCPCVHRTLGFHTSNVTR